MKIYTCGINTIPKLKSSAVCIGVFDGVHKGHQKILKKTVSLAKRNSLTAVAITMHPHPSVVLNPANPKKLLIPLSERLDRFKKLEVDVCIVLRFTKSFSKIKADRFVCQVLQRQLSSSIICVGNNFRFGYKGEGCASTIKMQLKNNFVKVLSVSPVLCGKKIVSSSKIRESLVKGDVILASNYLGRYYSVSGTQVPGDKIGRKIGYPTINITSSEPVILQNGVYAVVVEIGKKVYRGVFHKGGRPTFGQAKERLEIHIIDEKSPRSSGKVRVYFVKKIRNIMVFKGASGLVKQIANDIKAARRILTQKCLKIVKK